MATWAPNVHQNGRLLFMGSRKVGKCKHSLSLYICMCNETTVIGHCSTIITREEGGNLLSNECMGITSFTPIDETLPNMYIHTF